MTKVRICKLPQCNIVIDADARASKLYHSTSHQRKHVRMKKKEREEAGETEIIELPITATKKEVFKRSIYDNYTKENDHTAAAIYLAQHFGNEGIVQQLKDISEKLNNNNKIDSSQRLELIRVRDNHVSELHGKMLELTKTVQPEEVIEISASPKTIAEYYNLNKHIEKMIDDNPILSFSVEDKALLAKYSGYGGLQKQMSEAEKVDTKILYEYFTPDLIVQKMWGLAYKYGYNGGPILEPSAGAGAFLRYAPAEAQTVVYELNPYSAKILSVLYPATEIHVGRFEEAFIENRASIKGNVEPKFDLVIGNPPYGAFSGPFAHTEKKWTKARNNIDYFISRSLDLLKPGGLLVFVIGGEVSTGAKLFLDQEPYPSKILIQEKSKLLDAYRLPNGVFDRTDVLTDIIVLKKK